MPNKKEKYGKLLKSCAKVATRKRVVIKTQPIYVGSAFNHNLLKYAIIELGRLTETGQRDYWPDKYSCNAATKAT